MNRSFRWRVMILQSVMVLVLGGAAFALYGTATFSHSMISDQLTAQKIAFPPASTAVAGGALDPAEFPDLQQYAGQQVDTGAKAQAYANGFIGRHLEKVAGGQTYAEVSAAAIANPSDPKLAAQKQTLFQGETLRGLLLNAYGWWTVGTYALYAAVGIAIAAIVVLGAFLFELVEVVAEGRVRAAGKARAGVPARA